MFRLLVLDRELTLNLESLFPERMLCGKGMKSDG